MTDVIWNASDAGPLIGVNNSNALIAGNKYAVFGFAVDVGNKKLWVWNTWKNKWNNDVIANQNPATGTGGVSFPAGITSTTFPGVTCGSGGQTQTANFGATSFINSAPSGFSSWNALAGTTTLNPSDKDSTITLSGGNLTAAGTTNWGSVRATTSLTSGKGYFEIVYNGSATNAISGLANGTQALNDFMGGTTNSIGFQVQGSQYQGSPTPGAGSFSADWNTCRANTGSTTGKLYFEVTVNSSVSNELFFGISDGSATLTGYPGSDVHALGYDNTGSTNTGGSNVVTQHTYTAGDILACAIDIPNKKCWFYNPEDSQWNGAAIGSQNPATATGGYAANTWSGALYPCMGIKSDFTALSGLTANFGKSAFAYTIPSGFSAWQPGARVRFNMPMGGI